VSVRKITQRRFSRGRLGLREDEDSRAGTVDSTQGGQKDDAEIKNESHLNCEGSCIRSRTLIDNRTCAQPRRAVRVASQENVEEDAAGVWRVKWRG